MSMCFTKTVNDLTVIGEFDKWPTPCHVSHDDNFIRMSGIEEVKDLIYLLNRFVEDFDKSREQSRKG